MANYEDIYGSDLMSAKDLKSGPIEAEVEAVEVRDFGDAKKVVLALKGFKKKLVLNKTNAKRLAEIANSKDFEKWKGAHIQLYKIITTFQGEETDAIRIKGAEPENAGDV